MNVIHPVARADANRPGVASLWKRARNLPHPWLPLRYLLVQAVSALPLHLLFLVSAAQPAPFHTALLTCSL